MAELGETRAHWKKVLVRHADPAAWLAMGLLLGMGIRAVWLQAGVHLYSWGGLFLDMTGVMAAGLARGPAAALGVVVLNQVYRMAFGQPGNSFALVEVAGALFWGWMAGRRWVSFTWRRPRALARTFLAAALGGGAACALGAWFTNIFLRGQWDFMAVQQGLYAEFTPLGLLKALPGEISISCWDKTATALLAFAFLGALARWRPDARGFLSPVGSASLRRSGESIAVALGTLALWGALLVVYFLANLLEAPVAADFLLFRQTLLVGVAFLAIAVFLVLTVVRRSRSALGRLTFSLSWAVNGLSVLVLFLMGLYLSSHALAWSTYEGTWKTQEQVLSLLQEGAEPALPPGVILVRPSGAPVTERVEFIPLWKASHRLLFGDLQDIVTTLFPEHSPRPGNPYKGYIRREGKVYLATLGFSDPSRRSPVILYQEAPWFFSHENAPHLAPAAVLFLLILALVLALLYLLGRQMLRTAGEAALGRRARVLAQRISARNRELEALQRQLEEVATQRERRIRELSNLAEVGKAVAVLAHEIRNPVATIQMAFGNLLEALGTDPKGELQEQVVIIERQIRHMNVLTQSVLAFSRGAAGPPEERRCDARSVLGSCLSLFGPAAGRRSVRLEAEPPAVELAVAARENEVVQILQNVVLNAVEVLGDGAVETRRVVLSARREGPWVVFVVRDSGPGIPEADRERVFDLFFTRKTEGTGLGLFIARELARVLHGDLTIGSGVDRGTSFELRLPQAR
jgi:signal transduction histidine kinase